MGQAGSGKTCAEGLCCAGKPCEATGLTPRCPPPADGAGAEVREPLGALAEDTDGEQASAPGCCVRSHANSGLSTASSVPEGVVEAEKQELTFEASAPGCCVRREDGHTNGGSAPEGVVAEAEEKERTFEEMLARQASARGCCVRREDGHASSGLATVSSVPEGVAEAEEDSSPGCCMRREDGHADSRLSTASSIPEGAVAEAEEKERTFEEMLARQASARGCCVRREDGHADSALSTASPAPEGAVAEAEEKERTFEEMLARQVVRRTLQMVSQRHC